MSFAKFPRVAPIYAFDTALAGPIKRHSTLSLRLNRMLGHNDCQLGGYKCPLVGYGAS